MPGFPAQCRLLTAVESAAADRCYGLQHGSTWPLMQAAGDAVGRLLAARYDTGGHVHVLVGPGNNGADGLVAGAWLRRAGYRVTATRVAGLPASSDALRAIALYGDEIAEAESALPTADIYLDALFGAGLNRPLSGAAANAVNQLNQSGRPVVSIDLPSGIDGDQGTVMGVAVRAALTVALFRARPGHWLYPGREHTGELVTADIGLDPAHLETETITRQTALNLPACWLDQVPSHKYQRGRLWVLGGSRMTGAAALAAGAGLRSGAGLVGIAAPSSAAGVYRARERALLVAEADRLEDWQLLLSAMRPDCLVLGPGLGPIRGTGRQPDVADWLLEALTGVDRVVLDADALTAMAGLLDRFVPVLPAATVLTPHEGEFSRLFPEMTGARLSRARAAASRVSAVVVLKGRDTIIAAPDGRALVNANGTANLATAGTGDVLAGMIGALLARGMPAFEAAAAAVWAHAQTARAQPAGMIADDLLSRLVVLDHGVIPSS